MYGHDHLLSLFSGECGSSLEYSKMKMINKFRYRRTELASFVIFLALTSTVSLAQKKTAVAAKQNGRQSNRQPIPVESALLKTIEATTVAAEVSGVVDQIDVSEGSVVVPGLILGTIRDKQIQLQLERAEIELTAARRRLELDVEVELAKKRSLVAENEYLRAKEANQRIADTYPKKEIDRLKLVAESAELEIRRAESKLDRAKVDLLLAENSKRQAEELVRQHQIASPASGLVISIKKRPGEWVEPGTDLLQIVRIERLRIEGFVGKEALGEDLLNRTATVIVMAKQQQRVVGKVVFVSPDTNPVNGRTRVYLEVDNKNMKLRPGMRVQASIN